MQDGRNNNAGWKSVLPFRTTTPPTTAAASRSLNRKAHSAADNRASLSSSIVAVEGVALTWPSYESG